VTKVIRPGYHAGRPDHPTEDERYYVGVHYTNKPSCQGAAMRETYVEISTGDYTLRCKNCDDEVFHSRWGYRGNA
jgi:hypothetical protein